MNKKLFFLVFTFRVLAESRLSVAAAGDLMCHDSQLKHAYQQNTKEYSFSHFFVFAKEWISKADLAIANLETTLPGKDYAGYPLFGSPDSFAQAIKDAGFDVLVTANNHSLDRGSEGLKRTLFVLKELGFYFTGTYQSWQERKENPFLFLTANNLSLAILNYTFSTNGIAVPSEIKINYPLSEKIIEEDIKEAKKKNPDFIIVYYHFGNEYERYPNAEQKKWAKFAIEAGAHIVLGSHPHVIQPVEIFFAEDRYGEYRQRLVAYSLGNFISGQTKPHTEIGVLLYFSLIKNQSDFLIREIYPKFFYTYKINGAFRLEPLPELFEKLEFKKISLKKQQEIKSYYEQNLAHIFSFTEKHAPNEVRKYPKAKKKQ